jgi:predicted DNA-binding transcriptional regulator YafY
MAVPTAKIDGSLTVRFRASGMHEMSNHLFTWGTAVTVIEPDELRLYLTELAQDLAVHHGIQRERSRLQQRIPQS